MALPLLAMMGAGLGILGAQDYRVRQAQAAADELDRQQGQGVMDGMFSPGGAFADLDPVQAQAAQARFAANPTAENAGMIAESLAAMDHDFAQQEQKAQDQMDVAKYNAEAANRRNQAQIAANAAADNASRVAGAQSDGLKMFRQQYMQQTNEAASAQRAFDQFDTAIRGGTKADMVAAAITLAKLIDPNSVVREGEAQVWNKANSLGQQLSAAFTGVGGKGPNEAARQVLLDTGISIYRPYVQRLQQLQQNITSGVQSYNQQNGTAIQLDQVYTRGLRNDPEFTIKPIKPPAPPPKTGTLTADEVRNSPEWEGQGRGNG